jgi:hypothetical protein
MELESSSPYPQEPATCPYPEPVLYGCVILPLETLPPPRGAEVLRITHVAMLTH